MLRQAFGIRFVYLHVAYTRDAETNLASILFFCTSSGNACGRVCARSTGKRAHRFDETFSVVSYKSDGVIGYFKLPYAFLKINFGRSKICFGVVSVTCLQMWVDEQIQWVLGVIYVC